jgi:hypothetical protein
LSCVAAGQFQGEKGQPFRATWGKKVVKTYSNLLLQILQELSYQQAREQAGGTRSLELDAAQEQFQKWHLSASTKDFGQFRDNYGIPQETLHLLHNIPPVNMDEVSCYFALA